MSASPFAALSSLPLGDDQPSLESASGSVVLEDAVPSTAAFADLTAYANRWGNELDTVTRAEALISVGHEAVQKAYLYRSVSAALPTANEADIAMPESALLALQRAQHKALEPNMRVLKEIMRFVAESRVLFKAAIAEPEKRFSDVLATRLIELVDLNVMCDRLKSLRASYHHDHSAYKLAVEYLTHRDGFTAPGDDSELALFLPRGNGIMQAFKAELLRLEKGQAGLYQLVDTCLEHLDNSEHVTAQEKFMYLRAMPNLVFFLDHSDDPRHSLLRRKEISILKILKHLKKTPIVPLIGDMTYAGLNVLRESPSFHGKEGLDLTTLPPRAKLAGHYDMAGQIDSVRTEHNTFTANFKMSLTRLTARSQNEVKGAVRDTAAVAETTEFQNLVVKGLGLLTEWTSTLFAHFSFKYAYPFDDDIAHFKLYEERKNVEDDEIEEGATPAVTAPKDGAPTASGPSSNITGDSGLSNIGKEGVTPEKRRQSLLPDTNTGAIRARALLNPSLCQQKKEPADLYERAVKYNFPSRERFAVVEYIGMIKGLATLLLKMEEQVLPLLLQSMHDQIQEFVVGPIRDFLRKIVKKEANPLIADLTEFMNSVVDWHGKVPREDPALRGDKDPAPRPVLTRRVGPTYSQSALIRSVLWGYLNLRGKGLAYNPKDFEAAHIKDKTLTALYHAAYFYPALTNYSSTIRRITDLSDLWFREYHLELTGSVQFPIHMSIPWLLTEHILESVDQGHAATDYLLYPMAIYGDASYRALYTLKSKYLFEEVEAEVALAFDQLLFKLTDIVYAQFKVQASSIMLDKNYKTSLHNLAGVGAVKMRQLTVPLQRLTPLLQQRHFNLLGRIIDLARLLSQRLNQTLLDNVHFAITRFESASLMTIVAFERLIYNTRLTHYLMSEHVIGLDSFEKIYTQANESVSMTSFHGRVELHVVYELVTDLCGFSAFNSTTQRFIRTTATSAFREPLKRVSAPKNKVPFLYGNKSLCASYAAIDALYERYFGAPHARAIVRVVGPSALPLIVNEVLKNVKLKLTSVLVPYFNEVRNGLPDKIALPMHEYGAEGVYGVFYGKFRNLIDYGALVSHLFRHVAEWGNLLLILKLLDTAHAEASTVRLLQAASFLGVKPGTRAPGQPRPPLEVPVSTPLDKAFFTLSTTMQFNEGVKARNLMGSYLQNTRLIGQHYLPPKENYSLFKFALAQIQEMVVSSASNAHWIVEPGKADNDFFPIETTNEFHRIWSALLFVFCVDVKANMSLSASSLELFGDGFAWAGAALIHFLTQRHRFETFDFTYHSLKTNEVVQNQNEAMRPFFIRVAQLREVTNAVFATLEGLFPTPEPSLESIRRFDPPTRDEKPSNAQFLYKSLSVTAPVIPGPAQISSNGTTSQGSLGASSNAFDPFGNGAPRSAGNPFASNPLPPTIMSNPGVSPTTFSSAPSTASSNRPASLAPAPTPFPAFTPFPNAPDPSAFFDLPPAPPVPDEAAPLPPDLGMAPPPPTFFLGEAPPVPDEMAPPPPTGAPSFDDWDPFGLKK